MSLAGSDCDLFSDNPTTPPSAPPDSLIKHADSLKYWESVPSTVNGMLGGFPQISRIDLVGSSNFLAKLRKTSAALAGAPLARAVDCGAGIGRITLGLLAKVASVVDVVEPVAKFTEEMEQDPAYEGAKAAGRIGAVYNVGLEDWTPPPSTPYDLIWNQWCLGHLTDRQLVAYLMRCRAALRDGGWAVVKENISTDADGEDIFDGVDSSVTRSDEKFRRLFQEAGMRVVATELQRGFPRGLKLFPVRMYALRPER